MVQFGSYLDASVWLRHNALGACTVLVCKGQKTYSIARRSDGWIDAPVERFCEVVYA
jgi:hypothetical protein